MPKRLHSFARKMRKAREAAGLSQSELARRCGFQPSAVAHFESGRREPSLTNAIRLAKGLKKTLDELV
jgi:transcriptional regulator with XRE-family HTH domain